jgi:drug/metabolite transporter (DMT)-like permease
MNEFQGAYALALLAAFSFGSADFLGGLSTRRSNLFLTALYAQLAGCVVLGAGTLVHPGSPTVSDIVWGMAAGVADCAGLLLLFWALSIGQMAGVAPTSGIVSSALPIIVGFLLGERPAIVQWMGIALGLLAIAAISWERPAERLPDARRVLPIALAVAAGSGFAIYYILFSQISSESGVTPVLSARVASTVVVIIWIASRHDRFSVRASWRRPARLRLAVGAGILASGGNLLFVLAVRQGELGLVSVLASLYPAVTALLAIAFLRERPRAMQLAGIGAAVAAVGMIAAS